MGSYSITEQMVEWLRALGLHASTRPPEEPPMGPEAFATVERVGGGASDMVDRPIMAVQTWAPTEPQAEQMANAVRLAALVGPFPKGVHSLRVNSGPYQFYDASTRCPRYQLLLSCASQLTD